MHVQANQILSLVCKKTFTSTKALFRAACEGNVEFVVQVSKAYPTLMLVADPNSKWGVFFYAVAHRQAEVFSLIHGIHSN